MNKFFKPDDMAKLKPYMNAVDFFNRYGDFVQIFENVDGFELRSSTEAHCVDEGNTYRLLESGMVQINKDDYLYTKFEILTICKFEGNHRDAMNYVEFRILKKQIPFIRVGCDYFKINYKTNRYGVNVKAIKNWKKEEIKDDYGKAMLREIPRFDDFTIIPDNVNYTEFQNSMYNLYAKFPHSPAENDGEFKHIDLLLNHIFGSQVELGYKYMKVLYEMPQQILPVLVLASTERQTGKTTFLNFLEILFGDNYVNIAPDELTGTFNHLYATKNIIAIDETVLEKQSSVEKIKAIATQKSMAVNQKFVSQYKVPFFGKIIIGTNREHDFMRIDEEEIRFWVRRVGVIKHRITDIEQKMTAEIPYFLRYLQQLPEIDMTKSRMIFTEEEIRTQYLEVVMDESKNTLRKELEMLIEDAFMQDRNMKEFKMTAMDIKKIWFEKNNNYSNPYIHKVLKNDMKVPIGKNQRYYPLEGENSKIGTPYIFKRENFVKEEMEIEVNFAPEVVKGLPF